MIRFLHTADLQLGMGFGAFRADRRPLLQRARFECMGDLDASVRRAGHESPDFILVAGDFFDSPTLSDEVVIEACARVRALGLPTYVLPGNHDFIEGGLFRRSSFRDHAPPNLHVMDSGDPLLVADGRAVLLPAPLRYRRSAEDLTEHWSAELGRDLAPRAIRIGVAHGAVINFAARDVEGDGGNIIDPAKARAAALDYLALGDWHGQQQIEERTWYSGAPERTSFRENIQGRALLVELDAPGAIPRVFSIPTGRYSWIQRELDLHHPDHISSLETWFDSLEDRFNTVLSITMRGALGPAEMSRLDRLLERIQAEAAVARIDSGALASQFSLEDLDFIAVDGYVRAAVERLSALAASSGPEHSVSARALALLHGLRQTEAR